MNLIITGVSGFLGMHLYHSLKDFYNLFGIVGFSRKNSSLQQIDVYDISNFKQINVIPDVVVMCHASISSGTNKQSTVKLHEANVSFTEQIVSQFPSAYHLFVSTVSVYGHTNYKLTECSSLNPSSEYAISKLWGEKITSTAGNNGILRLSSLYGTGMKENTILPNYVNQALQKNTIEVWGTGERKQNYFYVEDAVQYIKAMVKKRTSGICLGVSSLETTNIELAKKVATLTDSKIIFTGEDKSPSSTFDNSITKKQLQINSEMELNSGLKEYIDWKK